MKRIGILLLLLLIPSIALGQSAVGATKFTSAIPTTDTNIYASGDLIGGKLTFTNALRPWVGTGYLTGLRISDKNKQAADLELVIFDQDPTGTTFTDNAAFNPVAADIPKIIAVVALGSTSRFAYSVTGVDYVGNLVIPLRALNSSSQPAGTLYGALVSRGTPTYTTSSALTIELQIAQD